MKIKFRSFTVVELLTVTVILWLILPSIITIYTFMIRANREFVLRENTIHQWYEFFEKLNILMQDYTIDYEEYYNRQMVWCSKDEPNFWTWADFKRNIWISWYCTEFTAYWNHNSTQKNINFNEIDWSYHDIYNCSSNEEENSNGISHRVVKKDTCWTIWDKQSFGQYKALFIDEKRVDDLYDWEDRWQPLNTSINAIIDANNIQELYLISHDGKNRLFLRRKLVATGWDYAQYRVQMLRLRWFDAWQKHSFDDSSDWLYDRQIDTWACDAAMWFTCNWSGVWWAYSGYHLPSDVNDWWIDLTYGNTTIAARNISISPLNDPELYWIDQGKQINPYMRILTVNEIYSPYSYSGNSILEFKVPLETTINMKDFYKE
jgi:hypothetical protein